MAVVIRMRRTGAKKRPSYRVVVADSKYQRDGRYIEQLGYYDPLTDPATFKVDAARFEQWIRNGARPSESVEVMMKKFAPQALRPAPLAPPPTPEAAGAPEPAGAPVEKPKRAKAAAKKKATPRRKAVPHRGEEKKAKTRAKAKTRKAAGVAKPKAAAKKKAKK
jgi:small subunit ribosomal protein S16